MFATRATDKWLIYLMWNELLKFEGQKNKNPIEEWEKKTWTDNGQKRYKNDPYTNGKVFNSEVVKCKLKQHSMISHLSYWWNIVTMERKWTPTHCDHANWYNIYKTEFCSNVTKLYVLHLPVDSTIPHPEIYCENIPPERHKDISWSIICNCKILETT